MAKIGVTKKLVGTAVFAALSFVVSFLEFPIFPATGFLKLDFSAVFTTLAGFIFGPVSGVAVCAIKELICFFTKSSTGGVGEIANFIVTTGYILIPTVVYKYRKGIKTVILTLLAGCIVQVGLALLANRFVNFPLFMGDSAKAVFDSVWYYVLLFNLIKTVSISILTILLYKRVSHLIKSIGEKGENSESDGVISKSEKQTFEIAKEYAKTLSSGDVVLLSGDLGAGKTAFTKGVASHFGFDGVVSPTYTYLNVYGDYIYHYDCYRLSSGEDAERLGLTDYFGGENICIIEWSENIKEVLPEKVKRVNIEKIGKNKRRIILSKPDELPEIEKNLTVEE